ncbi:MAG: PQQ-binding-like beta-propeller repeat protein [bacterium]|nr:PQQ-binding-like beta-propeller repeat protein [bacterium]
MATQAEVRILRMAASVALIALGVAATSGWAGEWASWRGAEQTGVSAERGLVSQWSGDGENLLWRVDFTGRSTPVVFDGRVCTNGRAGEGITRQEVVACWNAASGKLLWERRFNVYNTTVPWNRVGWGSVVGDPETGYLYAHPVDGRLVCLDRAGETVWERRLGEDLGRMSGYGGRTHTPILDEDRLILSVIGPIWGELGIPRHRYFAFDKRGGEVLWVSTPGGSLQDANTQSTPVVAEIAGRRLLIGGNADGWIYALQARTGEKVWGFHLSKRGLNSSVVVGAATVYASHSEENLDAGTMGRVVAIDGTGRGDVTATHERWRAEGIKAGFSSPLLHDGRLYVVDNSANLHALEAATGKRSWLHNLGTVGKASPVWADGKIYATEVNGNFHILRPGPEGATTLDEEHFEVAAEGRFAEIYGSPAVAYGRVYFVTEEGLYCLGDENALPVVPPIATALEGVPAVVPAAADAVPALIRVAPAEVVTAADEPVSFRAMAFDAQGNFLGETHASWSLDGLVGTLDDGGELRLDPAAGSQVGTVIAGVGELTAKARVRAAGALPWQEDFDALAAGSFPPTWLGGSKGATVQEVDGEKILVQPRAKRMAPRATIYLGPSYLAGYTIQADVRASQQGRRRPDLGLINSGYTLDLQGNHQRLEVRSWAAEKRMAQQQPCAWEMDVWYTIKLRVDVAGGKALIRGKVWRRDQEEPSAWTITVEDPLPIPGGSPGLYGFTPVEGHFDNVKVTVNS